MAAIPGDDDNDLNFSDSESENGDNIMQQENAPKERIAHKQMIAHKEMQPIDSPDKSPSNEFEAISPVNSPIKTDKNEVKEHENDDNDVEKNRKLPENDIRNENIEIANNKDNFEPISPEREQDNNKKEPEEFENVSDNDNETETSHKIDNDLNLEDKKIEDISTENVLKDKIENIAQLDTTDANNHTEIRSDTSLENSVEQSIIKTDSKEVEAPVPSPLSDVGEYNENVGSENTLKDIKESAQGSESPDFEVEFETDEVQHQKENENAENTEDLASTKVDTIADVAEGEDSEKIDATANPDTSLVDVEKVHDDTPKTDLAEAMEDPMDDQDDLIADIFGESDEEEEFEGFLDEELPPDQPAEKPVEEREQEQDSSDDEETLPTRDFVSDFDLMLQKRKEMNRMKRRSKKDFEIINDNDDIIAAMIRQMKDAAEEDRMLNQAGKAATKKLKMLPSVLNHLRKADLQSAFIDCGVLPAIKEWLTPLPDHALPHINIRKVFLKMLSEFPPLDKSALKMSGIGRAVMLLFKHPKETAENKKVAGKIISNWARPIFNVSTNFNELTREERENRDKQNIPDAKRRRLSSGDMSNRQTLNDDDDVNTPRKPGDKGWIGRARVPMPSHRDYVNRPVPKVDSYDFAKSNSKPSLSRYEKHARRLKEKKSIGSGSRKAVGISLNGSKMAL